MEQKKAQSVVVLLCGPSGILCFEGPGFFDAPSDLNKDV